MNKQELWQRYQSWLYYHNGLGIYLDISRMRFSQDFVDQLNPKFNKAFQDMESLESGKISNPDEKRMVGHYWLRAPELAPNDEVRKEITEPLIRIKQFVEKIHQGTIKPPSADKFTDILCVGIGGSALGPQFVSEALSPDKPSMFIHFIDNTDPEGIDKTIYKIGERLKSTLVIVTTKSGKTPETRNGMLEVERAYKMKGLKFESHAVAVTMPGSIMDELASKWLERFPMQDWVGGRTSELSAVGLLPAALQGIDIDEMLIGAKEMDEATRVKSLKDNPSALLALAWYFSGNGKGEKDMVVLPYKDSLLLFSRYLQQLVMESLGKEKDLDGNIVHQGIAVYGNKGSTDQHAYVQQLRDGVSNFFATFIEVLKDGQNHPLELEPGVTSGDYLSVFLQGTRQALYENKRDSITITIPEVKPRTIGALIAMYERTISFYASLVNINAYHQPGVEAGKQMAASILDLQTKVQTVMKQTTGKINIETLALQTGYPEEVEAVYKIVRHLAANNRNIVLEGDFSNLLSLEVSAI
ncbi:glucose-6-phosphate isomerase [Candidatus Atelocyanobacterium thalassae]|uniref:Glucose-6-phosphate isomerase n=1 Tax=cyanobacterium endosymbiont of Braarudosphaera bigelowii TaxID=1285375 RepID=A0ABM7U545_9CHRO|nr:glucose-6-phosphate isomerase [Candidatus Atelocyanobacterium thalassa]BDA39806.1 glucose-6-phosphate isomerase [cyanobacterium endosymbiont of Braarudosphaera bigelowii]